MSSKHEGKKFGELTVVSASAYKNKNGNMIQKFDVRCSCGNQYETSAVNVLYGKSTRCKNCAAKIRAEQKEIGTGHPLYRKWASMLNRCYVPATDSYRFYGARNITVCDRWRGARENGEQVGSIDGFHNFVGDMGLPPTERHSLDRIDNDGNYSPDNCRWATPEVQYENTRQNNKVATATLNGKTLTINEWCDKHGLRKGSVRSAIARGYAPEAAIMAEIAIKKIGAPKTGKRLFYKACYDKAQAKLTYT